MKKHILMRVMRSEIQDRYVREGFDSLEDL